jgi:hypothetical protein
MNHTLHTPQPGGFNLLNNGSFTRYGRRWAAIPNTATFRSGWAVDNVDMDLYARTGVGFRSDDNQLSGWDFSGVPGAVAVAPRNAQGYEITAPDPGNVLQIGLLEDGDIFLSQDVIDVKRLYGVTASFSFGGMSILGKPEVALEVVVDDQVTALVEVSAAAFGAYRRVGGYFTFPDTLTSAQVRIRVTGCAGELVGLSGVMGALGPRSANTQFSSSLVDRVVPAGTVFMVVGEACPSGYISMGDEGSMVLTSGTKSFQSVAGEFVRALGQTEHSHHPDDTNPLLPPQKDTLTTEIPLSSGAAAVNAVEFGSYVPYSPYPGEVPDQVLSRNHSHTLQTRMETAPPTFPVRYCAKL